MTHQPNTTTEKETKKLSRFVRGVGNALLELADEIDNYGFDKDSEELLSKIGSRLLFEAKAFTFRKD